MLAVNGFFNAHELLPMVEAWQRLIDLTQAELIVADHSPTACLAAFGTTPVVHVGNGFSVPPAEAATFPPLVTGGPAEGQEQRILEQVRQVQRRRGRPAPETLPGLFATAGQFVVTWPELDPYRADSPHTAHRPAASAGSARASRRMSRDFLPTCRPSIRRWIKSWPALANAGLEGEVYLRGAAPAMRQSLQATGLIVHESPLDLVHVLPRVSVIIHHAGSGVAELAMSGGCPQLLLPRHLEQKLTGDASGSPAQWDEAWPARFASARSSRRFAN